MENEYELILTIVNAGYSSNVVDCANNVGAKGATLIKGRGTAPEETSSVLGVKIQPEKDIILILCEKSNKAKIMEAISQGVGLNTEGQGITLSLPVETWSGICRLSK